MLDTPETSLTRRYLRLIESWIPYGMTLFAPWDKRPDCGHFFGGVFPYGLETSTVILTLAAAASSPEFDEKAAGYSRDDLFEIVRKGIRYLCYTHDTGPEDCIRPSVSIGQPKYEGKKWGERGRGFFRESQCGVSISALFLSARLADHILSEEERVMLRGIAEDYLERFSTMEPKSGVFFDTQMEENAWTGTGLIASTLMCPDDPALDQHLEHAYRWIFCAASKPSDRHDQRSLPNGKTVAEMVNECCTTLPDNTVENHGFVHPNYMGSALNQSSFAAVMLAGHGKNLPNYTAGHGYEIYQELLKWSDSMGVPLAVQGMDWPYFPITAWSLNHSSANIRFKDPAAAKMEIQTLETVEKMMKQNQGQMIPPETKEFCHGQQDPAIFRERQIFRLAFTYLLHRFLGDGAEPASTKQLFERQKGVHHYPHGGTVVHVHKHGRSVYSWRNGMTALVGPPEGLGLVGQRRGSILAQLEVRGTRLQGRIIHHRIREMKDRVIACTVESLENMEEAGVFGIDNKEIMRREVMFASLPEGETVIYERVRASADITVEKFSQGMISVINDPIVPVLGNSKPSRPGRSTRTIYHENGINKFEGYACRDNSADSSLTISHRTEPGKIQKGWVNVDGRLGVSYMGDGECIYTNRHFYKIWRAVEDDLEINSHRTPFTCSTGHTVCELVSLWLPEQSPGETRKAEMNINRNDEGLEISAGNWICLWDTQGEPRLTCL